MKQILLAVAMLLSVYHLQAQNKTAEAMSYKTAIGVRFWNGAGLNLKTFLDEKNAFEATAFLRKGSTTISGLYEFHGDLSSEGNFKWYIGAGANVSFIKATKGTVFGVGGVIGLDYKVKTMPLNFALDWQPAFQFGSGYGFANDWWGLAIRYTL
jgi:hypothetical protein